MEKTELQIEWEHRIVEFKASGQTQSKWCRENDLSLHKLRYWLNKLDNNSSSSSQEPSPKWIAVSMEEIDQEPSDSLNIKIGEAVIEVKTGFNPSFLAEVIRTLKTLC
ncbi:IS66 family insertion sequence element accessory protein TnpA [Bacillus sp. FJAT-29937]|uniref:IS66 family insertion sequence element accessory protein TnpA n=1 Tax=Bacillus sp. FJAT-29937 TaxID=1720553 RepID=UPI00082D53C0|nr:hypothetical protein [Bacillus sp. FJAT-29937]